MATTARKITPKPKPSQAAKAGTAVETSDVKEGVITYTPDQLRKDAKKRAELIAAPEDTAGRDVALAVQGELDRAKAAAPIVAAAVKDAKAWDEIHGKAAQVTRSLAEKLVALRAIYVTPDGDADMRGQSQEYRDAATSIYEKAGFDTGKAQTVQGAVRYHVSVVLREVLRGDERFAGGDEAKYLELCARYKINPQSAIDRQREGRAAVEGGSRLPALKLPADDVAGIWSGALQYAHKALELPGDTAPSDLTDAQRSALREELTAVRERAGVLLAELGDDE